MKPDYRTTAQRPQQPAASRAQRLRARIAAWWQRRLAQRDERIQREALVLLGQHLLQDIGVRDGVRVHAQAIRDARYERMARWIAR
jgi:hypothetical protein